MGGRVQPSDLFATDGLSTVRLTGIKGQKTKDGRSVTIQTKTVLLSVLL